MEEKIRRFLSESFFVDDIDASASFLDGGVLDSTGVLELVAFLEETFVIDVADDELLPENLDSVERLVRFIAEKQQTTVAA